MKISLDARTALISASSRGIGRGVAAALHAAGANVVFAARGASALEDAATALGGSSRDRVFAVTADVGVAADVDRLVAAAIDRFGGVDILVTNSGGPPPGAVVDLDEQMWAAAINANLLSVVRLCRLVLPGMRARRWGRIVNLSSTVAKEPDAGMALSASTRAAVAAYAKTLAREVGPDGITVNTVLTGGVLTERARALAAGDADAAGRSVDDVLAESAGLFPVGFIPTPDEFAPTVAFLCSEEAAFVNGVALALDGGYTRSTF